MDIDKQILAIMCHFRGDHGSWNLRILKKHNILALVSSDFVIVQLHILQLICLFTLLATDVFLACIVDVSLWNFVARVEEAFVIFAPGCTTELDPHELIVFEILSSFSISHVYCLPIRATFCFGIGKVFAIVTPVCGAHLGLAISIHSIWIHKDVCILQWIIHVNMIAAFLLHFIPLSLRHKATVVAKVVEIAMFARDADFWEVPIISNSLLKFRSRIALFEELIC